MRTQKRHRGEKTILSAARFFLRRAGNIFPGYIASGAPARDASYTLSECTRAPERCSLSPSLPLSLPPSLPLSLSLPSFFHPGVLNASRALELKRKRGPGNRCAGRVMRLRCYRARSKYLGENVSSSPGKGVPDLLFSLLFPFRPRRESTIDM